MKIIKKIAAIMLSVMMVLGMCSVVGAEGTTTSGTSATNDGKITIRNAVPKQAYTIYRILELESFSDKTAENSGNYAYKATSKWKEFVESETGKTYLETDGSGYVTWVKNADPAAFAKAALAYAKNSTKPIAAEESKNAPDATVGSTTSTVVFNSLPLGYYLVDSSVGALCSLNTTAKEVEIKEKNGVPSVDKKVKNGTTYEEKNTASIGDKVEFKTTITAQPGAQNYVLHDKMSDGLTFDNSVEVKKEGDTTALAASGNYELVTDAAEKGDDCTFHIKFTEEFCNSIKTETKIIVTYSAILNEKAKIKTDENTNKTWLKYGDEKESNYDSTITKTFEIPVFKYTNKGTTATEKPLAGAEFTLTRNDETEPIKLVKVSAAAGASDDVYRVAMNSDTGGTVISNGKVTTPSSGKLRIQGLAEGTYYLTETQQPAGYNILKEAIKIEIDKDGNIKYASKSEKLNSMPSGGNVKVLNNTGSLLPSTGGMGTTLFYIFGAILVIGSGVVLITKKRMK